MGSSRFPVFKDCYSFTTLNIGDNVKMIPDEAFFNCSELNSLTIPASVNSIGYNAFWGCEKLTSVYITDILAWCSINFGSAEANPLFYANHLYLKDEEIVDLIIPESITTIRNFTFNNCVGLTGVTIPSSVNVIGESAFSGCRNLLSVSFPESINIIKQKAFKGCSKLPHVTIPASVDYIYQEAFSDCISLKWIIIQSIIPPFAYENTFSNYVMPLIVPMGTTEAYKSAPGWKNFTNISEGGVFKLIYIVDGEEYKTNVFEIGTTIIPEAEPTKEGHSFSGWSEIPETMPANDITITGTFTINKYKLTYSVDGEEYKDFEVEYGTAITAIEEPTKEGFTFSGWSEVPKTMPANDVTVTGVFVINTYQVTYMIDDMVFKTDSVQYGANIVVPEATEMEGYTFDGWADVPEKMPAHDVTIYGTYTSGIADAAIDDKDVRIYDIKGRRIPKLQRGVNLIRTRDGRMRKVMMM